MPFVFKFEDEKRNLYKQSVTIQEKHLLYRQTNYILVFLKNYNILRLHAADITVDSSFENVRLLK